MRMSVAHLHHDGTLAMLPLCSSAPEGGRKKLGTQQTVNVIDLGGYHDSAKFHIRLDSKESNFRSKTGVASAAEGGRSGANRLACSLLRKRQRAMS